MKRVRGGAEWLLLLLLAILMCVQSGCGLVSRKPDVSPTMGKEQIQELMLQYLHEKYGEEFVSTGISVSPANSPLEPPDVWTMGAYRVGDSEYLSEFGARWRQPGSGSEITDNYLLVKMRPLFHDAIDEGLASVLPEFMAQYTLLGGGWEDGIRSLPGLISDEDFLQWAAQNLSLSIDVATPAEEGFTEDEFSAQIAPLVDSGNTFGVAKASLLIAVYHPEQYATASWSPPCIGPDIYGGLRTYPGGRCDFYDENGWITEKIQFKQTITLEAQ